MDGEVIAVAVAALGIWLDGYISRKRRAKPPAAPPACEGNKETDKKLDKIIGLIDDRGGVLDEVGKIKEKLE